LSGNGTLTGDRNPLSDFPYRGFMWNSFNGIKPVYCVEFIYSKTIPRWPRSVAGQIKVIAKNEIIMMNC
jgi:hypothetical protein